MSATNPNPIFLGSDGLFPSYRVPDYEPPKESTWCHVMFGHVPGWQQDFICRPIVPHGDLQPLHLSHMNEILQSRNADPLSPRDYVLAFTNLSRRDTQLQPGHGGLALVIGVRLRDSLDQASRKEPVFVHGLMAVNRQVTPQLLQAASECFLKNVVLSLRSPRPIDCWYGSYARASQEEIPEKLADYRRLSERGLPQAAASTCQTDAIFIAKTAPRFRCLRCRYPKGTESRALAECASRVVSVLFRSNIRWHSVFLRFPRRDLEPMEGVTVQFLREDDQDTETSGAQFLAFDVLRQMNDLAIASLFGAEPHPDYAQRLLHQSGEDLAPLVDLGASNELSPPGGFVAYEAEEEPLRKISDLMELASASSETLPVQPLTNNVDKTQPTPTWERWRFVVSQTVPAFARDVGVTMVGNLFAFVLLLLLLKLAGFRLVQVLAAPPAMPERGAEAAPVSSGSASLRQPSALSNADSATAESGTDAGAFLDIAPDLSLFPTPKPAKPGVHAGRGARGLKTFIPSEDGPAGTKAAGRAERAASSTRAEAVYSGTQALAPAVNAPPGAINSPPEEQGRAAPGESGPAVPLSGAATVSAVPAGERPPWKDRSRRPVER